ncbi:MAG: MazG nucleotide pyrophosphohydrolase domain-containing protein [Nitrososphaerota archaeon]
MMLSEMQRKVYEFERSRGWGSFKDSLIYAHLVEEVTEIGRFILEKEGYKRSGLGHSSFQEDIGKEFAHVLTLLTQLANRFQVDLERALEKEMARMEERFPAEKWRQALGSD